MSRTIVTVCASCPAGQTGFADLLHRELSAAGIDCVIRTVDCMSSCTRPSTLAFRAEGKTAYLFGDTGPDDLADIVAFAGLYYISPTGDLEDARLIGQLRFKAIARIPG